MTFKNRLIKISEALDITFNPEKHNLGYSEVSYLPSYSFPDTFFIQHYYQCQNQKRGEKLILLRIQIRESCWRISLESSEDFYPLDISSRDISIDLHQHLLQHAKEFKPNLTIF